MLLRTVGFIIIVGGAVVGGMFLRPLVWDTETDEPARQEGSVPIPTTQPEELSATEAEAMALAQVRRGISEFADDIPTTASCDAKERITGGWAVWCSLTNPITGLTMEQAIAYRVFDTGVVTFID